MINATQNEVMIAPEAVKTYGKNIIQISEDQIQIKEKIRQADENLTFSWLGASREFYYDASQSIQNRIIKDYGMLRLLGELMPAVAQNRQNTDTEAGNAASGI